MSYESGELAKSAKERMEEQHKKLQQQFRGLEHDMEQLLEQMKEKRIQRERRKEKRKKADS